MKPLKAPSRLRLKDYYTLLLETGLILSLLSVIFLTKIPVHSQGGSDLSLFENQEVVTMEEMIQTKQPERPPTPPRPTVPVEVPNSEIIEDEIIHIDAELRIDQELAMPSEPPAPPKETQETAEETFFVVVEEMPKLLGGIASIQEQIRYPEKARMAGIEGRVIIQFIVNEEGRVENPRVVRGIGGGCDEEALRVVSNAHFKPGKQRGKPVRVQFSLPVIFKLRQ